LPSALGLPPVPVPNDPPTAESIALGRALFSSKRLSKDGTIACASCHDPQRGFADPRRFSEGVGGAKGKRQAPPVLNAAFAPVQFWDGRAPSLEEQAKGPIQNALEMAHTAEGVERDVAREFAPLFARAFGDPAVTLERIARALADYERTLVSGHSPFDRYAFGGDARALSPGALRGLAVFRDPEQGNCAACHRIGERHALFTDGQFHNLGVGMNAEGELTDAGRYEVTKRDRDRGAFKTPSLRNVALTAPYMHDGSLKTLKEVVDFYVGGGNANPQRDPLLRPLTDLTKRDREDLVAFLEALTGEVPR
jgi:cytochrome c peroxidase